MTDHLETLILSEANRLDIQPNADAMRKAAIDLAGSVMTSDGLISIPGLGSISAGDFVRSLHGQMPEAFQALDAKSPAARSTGNLTRDMKAEIAANRRQRALPSDWLAVRSKATGTTAQHLAERERNWK
ncbi:hypothetical protein [Bradyrhizobium sp. URHC0002]